MDWKDRIASWPGKTWEFLKKVPGWAYFVGALVLALLVWMSNRMARKAQLADLAARKAAVDKQYEAAKATAIEERGVSIEIAESVHQNIIELLTKEETDIKVATAEGPVALAKKWNESFAKRKEK